MTLYLLEINNKGYPIQLAIIEGELEEFKDSTVFKAFTSYEEASSKLGKRWTGRSWEEVEHKPAEPSPHIPDTQLDNELAILEGMASMAEKLEKLEQNQITILEGIATQEEEHTP